VIFLSKFGVHIIQVCVLYSNFYGKQNVADVTKITVLLLLMFGLISVSFIPLLFLMPFFNLVSK